jgi:hypothetical protein
MFSARLPRLKSAGWNWKLSAKNSPAVEAAHHRIDIGLAGMSEGPDSTAAEALVFLQFAG